MIGLIQILVGLAIAGGAGWISLATYQSATARGGNYVVLYGAVIFGLLMAGRGLLALGEDPPRLRRKPVPVEIGISTACIEQLRPLLQSLMELESRVEEGVTLADYDSLIDDAIKASDDVDLAALPADNSCREVAGLLESALATHIETATLWFESLSDPELPNDEIDPELNVHWATATDYLSAALLRSLPPQIGRSGRARAD